MLEVLDLGVTFGATPALDGFDLVVERGERAVVMGPSGSGKSTLLRVIAGLQRADRGSVRWNGHPLDDVPAHLRDVGLMFQDYALFPHRSVGGNVAFGLRMRNWDRARIDERVAEMLELVGMPGTEHRDVATLSGGEQQRVALARTLAPDPRLVLLDEPLGALDRTLRDRLLVEMPDIFDRIAATVLYVTHDRDEAFAIGHRVTVIARGRVAASGTPEALWRHPPSRFVAEFLGLENVFPASVVDGEVGTGWLAVPLDPGHPRPTAIAFPPEAVAVDLTSSLHGTVMRSRFLGGHHLVTIRLPSGDTLTADLRTVPPAGSTVPVTIDRSLVTVLDT